MVCLAGITTSWRNPPEECYSAENCHLIDEESTGRMIMSMGITNLVMRNPPEEWNSARNCQLKDEKSTQGIGFHRE
jgi:hypothetical protein